MKMLLIFMIKKSPYISARASFYEKTTRFYLFTTNFLVVVLPLVFTLTK
jgi:hypothetical protein